MTTLGLHSSETMLNPHVSNRKTLKSSPKSLFSFLAAKGGLRPCDDVEYVLDTRFRHLVKRNGMTLDHAREACVEAGYMPPVFDDEMDHSSIREFLDLLDREARGERQYQIGMYVPERERDDDMEVPKPRPMTHREFIEKLRRLELTPSSKRTAAALGYSVRQVQHIAAMKQDVPRPMALLVDLYLKHGLPSELRRKA
jgi:hypothetical protein